MLRFRDLVAHRRRFTHLVAVGAVAAAACRVDGVWTLERTDPPGTPFPVEQLRLDANRGYSALWTEGVEQRGSSGEYRWNGYQLKIAQAGRDPRTYGARLGLDGKLRMTYSEEGRAITAILTRRPRTTPDAAASASSPGEPTVERPDSYGPTTSSPTSTGRPAQPR